MKPSIFIGSSSEALEVARAFRQQLASDGEITLWNEGVFTLGQGYLESLANAVQRFDFAILIFVGDDQVESRGVASDIARDNVMFELGLFMGRLGRERTFVAYDQASSPKVPSDLAGVSLASFDSNRDDGNLVAAVGAAADSIRAAIRDLGVHESRSSAHLQQAADTIDQTSEKVTQMIHLLVRSRVSELSIVSKQFALMINDEDLSQMRKDLEDLEKVTLDSQVR